jgi:heme o synthase
MVCLTVTTMMSYGLAPGAFELMPFLGSALGTSLAVVSAQTWNQLIEVDRDRRMLRTEKRPLPLGLISKNSAVVFGVASAALGGSILLATCPMTSFSLAMANVALYSVVYTPLKVVTPLNTYVGAWVGAIPPMIGWVAKTGLFFHHGYFIGEGSKVIQSFSW